MLERVAYWRVKWKKALMLTVDRLDVAEYTVEAQLKESDTFARSLQSESRQLEHLINISIDEQLSKQDPLLRKVITTFFTAFSLLYEQIFTYYMAMHLYHRGIRSNDIKLKHAADLKFAPIWWVGTTLSTANCSY